MTPGITTLVKELLGLLDQEVRLLELRCDLLDALSEAFLRRDNDALEGLLEQVEAAQRDQAGTDRKLAALRQALAGAVGCDAKDLRLSRLIGELSAGENVALDYRRRQVTALTEELRRRHLRTAVVVSECARVNRALLASLLPCGETVTTYGTGGTADWRQSTGLVDAEF